MKGVPRLLKHLVIALSLCTLTLSNILKLSITNTNDFIGDPIYCSSDSISSNSVLCNVRSAFMYCNLYSNTNTSCQIGNTTSNTTTTNTATNTTTNTTTTTTTTTTSTTACINIITTSSSSSSSSYNSTATRSSLITYNTYNTTSNTTTSIPKLSIDHVSFSSFSSTLHGAILYSNNSIILNLISCVFFNSTSDDGGSFYFNNSINGSIVINSCQFISNKAQLSGGVMYLNSNINSISIASSTFYGNSAVTGWGGVIVSDPYSNISHMAIDGCSFQYNTATESGGVFELSGSVIDSSFTNSHYINNTAIGNAGAIRIYSNSFRNIFCNNTFKYNSGYRGADILLVCAFDTLIENNTMIESKDTSVRVIGISTYQAINNTVRNNIFINCSGWVAIGYSINIYVINNTCTGLYGGFSNVSHSSNILMSKNTFENGSNKIIYILTNNYNISIIDCYFGYNTNELGNGGAIYIDTNNTIVNIINSTFENNSAQNGGAIYSNTLNSYLTIASCKFIGNSAAQNGGAINLAQKHTNFAMFDYTTYSNSLQLQTSHPYTSKEPIDGKAQAIYSKLVQISGVSKYIITFDSQTSLTWTDGFYIYSNKNKTTVLYSNTNNAATWPGVNDPSLVIYGYQFYVEMVGPSRDLYLQAGFYGFLCNVYPIFFTSDVITASYSSLFYQNTAINGAALYLSFLNTFSVIFTTDFIDNKAVSGGAIEAYLANYGLMFQQLRFINNTASNGGGMLLASSNYGCQISECLFMTNTAKLGAGLFFGAYNGAGLFNEGNEVLINATYFIQNNAVEGAGVVIDYENIISFNNVTFVDNTVSSLGAALCVDTNNAVNITLTVFTNNAVTSEGKGGAGLASEISNNITINNTTFANNSAAGSGAGGALWLQGDTALTVIGSNMFVNNSADIGGAIFGRSIPLWSTNSGSLTLISNEALIGSAISIALFTNLDTVLTNITMIGNTAKITGTFFWLCQGKPNLSSCQEPKYQNVVFTDNIAPYGNSFATQPIHSRTSNEYNVTIYDGPLKPSLTLSLYDFYNHLAISDNFTTTTATVVSYNCDGLVGTLESSTIQVAIQGIVTFADISANCNPNGNITVQYTSQPPAKYFNDFIVDPQYNFITTSIWNFRSCYSGEKYLNGACVSCVNGTYSLVYSEDQSCQSCPAEAVDCYGNDINLEPGYWRISDASNNIFTCPYLGCKGGYGVGEELCNEGYEGILCAVCSTGYYYNSNSNQCLECRSTEVLSISVIVVLVVVFIGLLGFSIYAYVKYFKQINNDDSEVDESLMVSLKAKVNRYYKKLGPIITKAKIIISTFQILSISLQSFKISMPQSYTKFISGTDILSIDIINVMPIGCIKRLNFVDSLIIKTVFFPCFVGLLFICLMIEFSLRSKHLFKKYIHDQRQLKVYLIVMIRSLKFRYISLALLFSYLYLPGLTVGICQTFICENVDPDNATPSQDDYYLVADYSMNCSSNYMKFAKVYASFMIILYPIGVPLFYYWLLFKNRYDIIHRDDTAENRTTTINKINVEKPDMKMFKFLYDSYKPQYWYFELVETSRRLILTGALSVINTGESSQVVLGITIALLYMKIYAYYQPYELQESSTIAEFAQYQIYFTFFGSLVVQNELLEPYYNNLIGGLMIVLNLSAVLLCIYFEYMRRQIEASDETTTNNDNKKDEDDNTPHDDVEMIETPNPLLHRIEVNTPSIIEQLVEKYLKTVTVSNDNDNKNS